MNICVVVVDDHNLYRKGMINILSLFTEIKDILEFSDGKDYVDYLIENPKENNHIVLLDYMMPLMNGNEVCVWIKINRPLIKSIIVSQFDDQHTIRKVKKNGANGYLLKDTSLGDLKKAILSVHQNKDYYKTLLPLLGSENNLNNDYQEVIEGDELTEREKEIAKLICQELSYKEIATQLDISTRTVETHKNRILKKIGSTKLTGIVVYATKHGWI